MSHLNDNKIQELEKTGLLLASTHVEHEYPHCWRCHKPVVFRTTEQWFMKVEDLREKLVQDNENVHWVPKRGKDQFNAWTKNLKDNSITRQRFWGIPLPIWEDEDGNYEVIESKEELEEKTGRTFTDLHIDDLSDVTFTGKTGKVMTRVPFTADVWFDSGCASFASHYGEGLKFDEIIEKYYPISWITEGEDQIRGWFSSLFNVGTVVTGKAPYNQVLFQGFVMAKDGVKMSKSLGNGIDGVTAIEKYGSDATRFYLLTKVSPESKLNFDEDEFSQIFGFFNTLDNVFKFSNSYLEEHEINITPSLEVESLEAIDKWILYRLNRTIVSFSHNLEKFKTNFAFKDIENFLIGDFSKTYLKLVKDRCDERDENLLMIINQVLKKVLVMLGCAIPFKCEDLYLNSGLMNKKESLFLEGFPIVDERLIAKVEEQEIDKNFDLAQNVVGSILNAREKVKIGVRWPLGQVDIVSTAPLSEKLAIFEPFIKKHANIVKVNYDLDGVEMNYIVKPNFPSLKQSFSNPSEAIKAINLSKHYIANDLKEGHTGGKYEGIELDFDKHIIKEVELSGDLVSSDFNVGNVILHTAQDEILLEEGYLRELIRRVQSCRKDLGLEKKASIELSFEGSDEYFIDLATNWQSVISKKVGASDILAKGFEFKKEFTIKDKTLIVSIK